jgi:hypothetical protein
MTYHGNPFLWGSPFVMLRDKGKDTHDEACSRFSQLLGNVTKIDFTNYCVRRWTGLMCVMIGISGGLLREQ